MIESLGIDGNNIVIIHDGGRVEEFKRCMFPNCHLFHSTRLEMCLALGLSFAEEERKWQEARRQEEMASQAEKNYRQKHLEGARNKWRGWLGLWGGGSINIRPYLVRAELFLVSCDRSRLGLGLVFLARRTQQEGEGAGARGLQPRAEERMS